MKLSILVINWNTIDLLNDCLRTTEENLGDLAAEIIVVDNASSDGSPEMVEERFPNVTLIKNQENRGFAAANNQAMDIAGGEYVLLLNSDTLVHGDVLVKSVEYLDTHPEVGAMGCKVLNRDGTTQLTCSQYPSLTNILLSLSGLEKLSRPKFLGRYHMTDWQRDTERPVDVISGCYLAVRAEVIQTVGKLDEDFFFFGEETDWCRRISKAGWQLRLAPIGTITHFGGGSVSKLNHQRDVMLSSAMVRLHRKNGGLVPGIFAWLLTLAFNSSRAAYWALVFALRRSEKAQKRMVHFWNVVIRSGETWAR